MRGPIILLILLALVPALSPVAAPGLVRPKVQPPAPQDPKGSASQGAVLILTDIHFDPFTDPAIVSRLAASPVEDWRSIFESSQDRKIARGTVDTGYPLFASAIQAAQKTAQDSGFRLDYVMNNGDFLAHNFGAKYTAAGLPGDLLEAFTIKTLLFVSRSIQDAFPDTPVISAFGNNDSTCGDYFAPGAALLAAAANDWKAVAADRRAAVDFAIAGYYELPHPTLRNQELIVLNTTLWSANYHAGCGSPAGDPGAAELQWLGAKLAQARAAHKIATLVMHIPPGMDGFASARRGDCGQPAPLWNQQYLDGFLDTVRANKDVLRDAYAGHSHHNDFRVLAGSAGRPFLEVHITPSLSPVYSNNPGFEVVRYDHNSGALSDYSVEYLRNYFNAGGAADATPQWAQEYDFREAYGTPSGSPQELAMVAERIRSDPAVRAKFDGFYGVETPRPPDITENNWRFFSCAQTEISPPGYSKCVCPVPAGR